VIELINKLSKIEVTFRVKWCRDGKWENLQIWLKHVIEMKRKTRYCVKGGLDEVSTIIAL